MQAEAGLGLPGAVEDLRDVLRRGRSVLAFGRGRTGRRRGGGDNRGMVPAQWVS
ncbi:hypothetical protein [Streptosporangium sp. CA-115845]|uniref:hypothetical protein n=1 Tax=Streptosporangium sp. CA-115845 TaxID=3240071 RepID=UPI003D94EFDA